MPSIDYLDLRHVLHGYTCRGQYDKFLILLKPHNNLVRRCERLAVELQTNPGGHSIWADHRSDGYHIGAIGIVLRLETIDGSFVGTI